MAHEETVHKITYTFNVTIDRDDDEDEDRCYSACCRELTGCRVHASSETEALERIDEAIGRWLFFANRCIDDDFDVEDYM